MTTTCEKCGSDRFEYEQGFVGAHDEPARDDTLTCLDCGEVTVFDKFDRLEAQADDKYDEMRERDY